MNDYRKGDFFVFPLRPTGEWMVARLMLDIERQCVQPKRIEVGSPLYAFPKALLIEVYRPVVATAEAAAAVAGAEADVLMPGILVSQGCFGRGGWRVVGHRAVDPAAVAFPEALVHKQGRTHLVQGEVSRRLEISFKKAREINAYPTEHPCGLLDEIVLYQLGRADEIGKPEAALALRDLARSDLRFSPHRAWVYEQLGEAPDASYHQLAQRRGHDLRRFYG
jgi:hypothetical protein